MAQVTKLLMFMVCIAAAAAVMQGAGLTSWTGLHPQAGIQHEVNQSQGQLKHYSASRESGSTSFIGSIIAGVGKVVDSFKLVFALYSMLVNLGLPGWLAAFISAPVYFSFGLFVVYMLSGRRTSGRL